MSNHNDEKESEEGRVIEGHNYDGIQELDNSLPAWWLNGFYLTIVFSAVYILYLSVFQGPSLVQEYEHDRNAFEYAEYQRKAQVKLPEEGELRAFLKDPNRLANGGVIFKDKCTSCHGDKGQGGIGPNLTDDYWIHGGKMTEILKVVMQGVPEKGMPPWNGMLKLDEIYSVVAFVKSLRGTHPPNPKAPQGELAQE